MDLRELATVIAIRGLGCKEGPYGTVYVSLLCKLQIMTFNAIFSASSLIVVVPLCSE